MKFDKILDNNKLWAVRYENETDNVLRQLFSQWSDPEWLMSFFCVNMRELNNMERVRNLLIQEGAIDADGFVDYMSEINGDYLYETENS